MKRHWILFLIFLLALVLRFYKLDSIPNGLQQDETSIGYNAYSILLTGKDEYGVSMPLYFKAFGEYKLPGYIYGSVLPIRMFGLTPFSVRFLSAFTGSLTVLALYLLVCELFFSKNKDETKNMPFLALIASGMLAINPWHLHFSRGAFEVTPALFFITLGVALLLRGVRKQTLLLLLLGVTSVVLSVYTYNIARILGIAILIYVFVTHRKQLHIRRFILPVLLLKVVLLLPFALSIFSTAGIEAAQGQLIFSSAVAKAPLIEYRSYMNAMPPIVTKLLFNSFNLTLWHYGENIVRYVSGDFFFVSGSSHGNHGIGTSGQFYLFSLPLFLWGLYSFFKANNRQALFLAFWASAVVMIASLTREAPQATRSFFVIIPITLFSAEGLVQLIHFLKKRQKKFLYITATACFLIAAFNIIHYFASYYLRFPVVYAKAWRSAEKEVSEYIKENAAKYDQILIDRESGFMYTSLLFYSTFSPDRFQTTAKRAPDDNEGFSMVESFGTIRIRPIDWNKDPQTPRTLIITTAERKPADTPASKTFYYPRKHVVLALKQEIVQYPVEEIAYVAVE